MKRNVTADTLEEALRGALAALADKDRDEVELDVTVPGLDVTEGRRARVTIDLEEPRDEDDEDEDEGTGYEGPTPEQLDEEADYAADILEGLLDRMQLPGDLKIRVFDDHAEVEIVEVGSGALIGRRGSTLEAIQELVRCSLQRQFERRTRVKIDVEGYRVRRLEKYKDKALEAIEEVQSSGESQRLEPMDVFERKAIHHLVAEHEGVSSHSQGREPGRRIIIEPTD
ncbi:MAG: R3H domain-containing nucleic acid-binding protein [Nitriliruptorales bacterium]|nr:R3H domain-containing nucleic acid-binding protein [Nitriliruptorales bacterium]